MENKLRSLHKETGICIGWKWISAAIHTQVNKQQSFGFFFFFCRSKMTSFFLPHQTLLGSPQNGSNIHKWYDIEISNRWGSRYEGFMITRMKNKDRWRDQTTRWFLYFFRFLLLSFFFFSFGLGFLLLKKKNIWPLSFFFLKINDRKVQK